MAHAVSGSAYSAKGGNLKFADVVRERFRGPAFGQDFTTWLDEVLLGFETANISESSQVTHLVAFLESPNREIAVAYLKKWKEENPQPEPAARAADRESAMRDYHRAQWQALVAHLKTQSTVVGTRPEMRLEHDWKDMKQLPGESVAMYNYRLQQLVTKMTEMPTADRPTERSIYTTFVSGLKPRLRATVQVQCSHFDYDAAVSKAELLEETIRQTEEDEYELSESPPPRPLRRERAEARDELGFKFGGRYQDTYADERQWGGGKRFRPNQPRGNGRPTYATPKVESNRELQLLRQGARGRGLGQARSRPQAVFQTAPGKANAGRENHYGPTSGAKRKAGEPGCRHEICFPFLKDGRCRFGDECERVHVPTLDARQDVRRHVKTSIDEPMRQAARDWLKNRDTSRPPNNKPSGPMTTVAATQNREYHDFTAGARATNRCMMVEPASSATREKVTVDFTKQSFDERDVDEGEIAVTTDHDEPEGSVLCMLVQPPDPTFAEVVSAGRPRLMRMLRKKITHSAGIVTRHMC